MTQAARAYLGRKRAGGRDPYLLMHPEQRKVSDAIEAGAKSVGVLCGRRSGKTEWVVLQAIRNMQRYPGCQIPYIALTRPAAKRILWAKIKELNDRLQLGLRTNESELTATAPNGSVLYLVGADRPSEVEKLRGQKYPFVPIDEAASFKPSVLDYLTEDVLEAGLMDMDGVLALVGTPSAACVGPFYRITTERPGGWFVHRWTVLDNPFIPHAAQWLERKRKDKGWDLDNPTYRREYMGEWVLDTDALVYRFSRDRNLVHLPDSYFDSRQRRHWQHVVGIDYGYVDSTAWVVWAFQTRGDDKRVWAVESFKQSELLASESAERTQELSERYDPIIVGDSGGLGKPYVMEARRRFGLPIKDADKREKLAHIELMNDAFRTGQLHLVEEANRDYIEELSLLQWDMEKVEVVAGGKIRHDDRKREDPRYENHLCDAGLYGHGETTAFFNTEATGEKPRDPSEDALDRERAGESLEAGWLQAQRAEEQSQGWWDRPD